MTTKTYEIDKNYPCRVEGLIKKVIETPNTSIEDDLKLLEWYTAANSYNHLGVGRGGSHIYLTDCWDKRIAIIYYRD